MWSEKAGGIYFVLVGNGNIDTHTLHDTVPFNLNIYLEKEETLWSGKIMFGHGKNTTPLPAINELIM